MNAKPKDLDDVCRAGHIKSAAELRARVEPVTPPLSHAEHDEPPAFPIGLLPPAIQTLASECARALAVPAALPAACCLATVSAALGSRLRVRSITGKTSSGNLMVLIGAESGTGKSEVHRVSMAPFHACHEREKELWAMEVLPNARAEVKMLTAEIKKCVEELRNPTSNRPGIKALLAQKEKELADYESQTRPPFYHASDFTTPELIKMLCRMDGQLFTTSPDAKNFVDMVLGRYNEGGTDEEVYLKAFSLESIDRHRVGDGNHETPEACITGLWLTQPDKLERLLAKRELSEGGLIPRLLMASFSCPPTRVNMDEQGIDTAASAEYGKMITALFYAFRMGEDVKTIEAEYGAKAALVDFHNATADRREVELRDVTSFAARWGEHAWRLSLVVHAARLGDNAADRPLSLDDAQAGIALTKWFAWQQLDALRQGRQSGKSERHKRVLSLFTDSTKEITARDVYRARITPRDDTALAKALLEEMVEAGLLSFTDKPTAKIGHLQRSYQRSK